jgi:UDP-glucose 4,6-dehydratase
MEKNENSYLITGALGFIGSNFTNHLAKKEPKSKFIILDKLDYCSSIKNIDETLKNIEIIIGNILDQELVIKLLKDNNINYIVHFAASSHVSNSFFNSIEFTENNVLGTHKLLESTRIYCETLKLAQQVPNSFQETFQNFKKFIHISTDEVYGEVTDNIMRCEKALLAPTNPYAATKAAAEFIVKSYFKSYKLPIIITRSNNVYGINQYPEKIIPKFICQLLNDEKITIEGSGSQLRHFIHVKDVISALETILEYGIVGEMYNISAPELCEYTVRQIAEIICKLFGKCIDENIIYTKDRNFNDHRYYVDSTKLKLLGWEPKCGINDEDFINNIKELINWYSENRFRYIK